MADPSKAFHTVPHRTLVDSSMDLELVKDGYGSVVGNGVFWTDTGYTCRATGDCSV